MLLSSHTPDAARTGCTARFAYLGCCLNSIFQVIEPTGFQTCGRKPAGTALIVLSTQARVTRSSELEVRTRSRGSARGRPNCPLRNSRQDQRVLVSGDDGFSIGIRVI